jgi:hypothetical protein
MRRTAARLAAVGGLACVSLLFAAPFASATPSASLTIVSTAPGWGGKGQPLLVEILAYGPAPGRTILANSQGLNEVVVSPVTVAACKRHAKVLYTSLGTSKWCLKISAPNPGSAVSGTLVGKRSSVVLTVSVRTNLAGWPILAAIGGFLLGIIVAFIADLLGKTRLRFDAGTVKSLLYAVPTATVAVTSVVGAVYLPNATFGSGSNYWSLALAATSSSSAATIATWLVAALSARTPVPQGQPQDH